MSIASDIRTYADTAVSQGKQVLGSTITTAQAQLNDVTGQANEFYGKTKENVSELAIKATGAVNDLRASAEKAVNLDAIRTAVEPYIAQAKGYRHTVTDRAEALFAGVKSDERVAKLVDAAGLVVAGVQDRVVKPVQAVTGLGTKPAPARPEATVAAKPAPAATAKPATTTPATNTPATAKPAATKAATTTKPATTTPTARKAPAKRTTTS